MKRQYKLFNQEKPNYCVGTVLQMLLDSYGYSYSQEELLSHFDYIDYKGTSVSKDSSEDKYPSLKDLNSQIFVPLNIPLEEKYVNFSFIDEWDDDVSGLVNAFNKGNDVIVFANYKRLIAGDGGVNADITTKAGHCFLVLDVINHNDILLISPELESKGGTEIVKTSCLGLYHAWYHDPIKAGRGYSVIKKKG